MSKPRKSNYPWAFTDERGSSLERSFVTNWLQVAPSIPYPIREYQPALPDFKWRIDFAYVDEKIAIEAQGGTWIQGHHSRGKGVSDDYKKHNWLTLHGWRCLYFTSDMLADDPALLIDQIVALHRTTVMYKARNYQFKLAPGWVADAGLVPFEQLNILDADSD